MSDGVFDSAAAISYDASCADMFDDAVLGSTVDFLARLAGPGPVLEFAIGTGRVALPLHARGVDVSGLELSRSMVDQMLAKPGSAAIPVTIGDMATTVVDGAGSFSLVYLVFNTIGNLLTQAEQVACFRNAAAHLAPGGRFVVELGVPPLRRLPMGDTFVPFDVSDGHLGVGEYDVANQRMISHHFWVDNGVGRTFRTPHRFVWPAELDLMAQLAGMTLLERWSDWQRAEFTSESAAHVSVWHTAAH